MRASPWPTRRACCNTAPSPAANWPRTPSLFPAVQALLRGYEDAAAYPPNRVLLGHLYPDALWDIDRPWHQTSADPMPHHGPHGHLMLEEEFYALLKLCDPFDLLSLEEQFAQALVPSPDVGVVMGDVSALIGSAHPLSRIESIVADPAAGALPLRLRDGRLVGCISSGHGEDASLTADVLLENLACKATAVAALRSLLHDEQIDPGSIDYVINCGEEAVGDRYQRGGGNLAKAVAEACWLRERDWGRRQSLLLRARAWLGDGRRSGQFRPLQQCRCGGRLLPREAGHEVSEPLGSRHALVGRPAGWRCRNGFS